MTDLLHDRARSDDPEVVTATRVVLDTSVLISDPECITAFPGDDAVIPLVVVEELDQHKSRLDDVGRAARAVIRSIEELRVSLFAQSLGTAHPVSEKRIRNAIAAVAR